VLPSSPPLQHLSPLFLSLVRSTFPLGNGGSPFSGLKGGFCLQHVPNTLGSLIPLYPPSFCGIHPPDRGSLSSFCCFSGFPLPWTSPFAFGAPDFPPSSYRTLGHFPGGFPPPLLLLGTFTGRCFFAVRFFALDQAHLGPDLSHLLPIPF